MKLGFVETPKEIAQLMVDLASVGRDDAVLDVGCGKGVFLQVLRERGYANVYGIEIDEELFRHCRENFENVILGDFLVYEFESPFDLIVGNPPYVHFSNIPKPLAKRVREITKTGEGNLYYAFILRAISLLKDGGEFIYIVPYHFFYNTHAKYLRQTLLASGKIEAIIDLDEARLFRGESPETVIFKFRKGQYDLEKERITVLRLKHTRARPMEIYTKAKQALESKTSNDLFSYYEIPHFLHSHSWSVHVFTRSFSSTLQLKDLAKVGVGLISGLESAFCVSEEELESFEDKEKALGELLHLIEGGASCFNAWWLFRYPIRDTVIHQSMLHRLNFGSFQPYEVKVYRCIHIPVVGCPTYRTSPNSFMQSQVLFFIATAMT
jgi:Predicted DNA modification methylase